MLMIIVFVGYVNVVMILLYIVCECIWYGDWCVVVFVYCFDLWGGWIFWYEVK